jgi:hypothetical protein
MRGAMRLAGAVSEDGDRSGRSAASKERPAMNEAICKAIEELEALACDLERQVAACDKDVPRVSARLRALAAHLAAYDQSEGTPRFLPGAATARGEQSWHVVLPELGHEPSV